jgi:sugar/nucleoside kinase (ribokinase family)
MTEESPVKDDRTLDVVGIGNAIVDVLANVSDGFLARHGLAKGVMTLIDADRAVELHREMENRVECSGGSAANTVAGIASLGGSAAYVGMVRDDPLGDVFRRDIRAAGVEFETAPAEEGPPTGRCLVLVTPDAQRTMQTFLGASATLAPGDVDEETIARARITYLEGYLWDPPPAKQAFLRAAEVAHAAGRKVALSLSDAFCVERHRAEFRDLLGEHVDVLLANESEVLSLYETADLDDALDRLRADCETAAVTRGAAGSVVLSGGRTLSVEADPVEGVVDTTGAGDLFASGFLFGLTRGESPERCGRIGSLAAAEIIGHFGARPETSLAGLLAGSGE